MTRWRTLNKRARRRRERDIRMAREVDRFVREGIPALQQAFDNLGKALGQFAAAFGTAVQRMNQDLMRANPEYAQDWRRQHEWPDVIYENSLDAEFIGE